MTNPDDTCAVIDGNGAVGLVFDEFEEI